MAITLKLLTSWGYDGFLTHTETVSQFYRRKRDVFERGLRKNLEGLAEWTSPEAGMFVWWVAFFPFQSTSSFGLTVRRFKLLLNSSTSSSDEQPEGDSEAIIRTNALEKGVLALPGTVFLPNGRKTAYVRASFSLVNEADVDEALRRLREVVLDARRSPA